MLSVTKLASPRGIIMKNEKDKCTTDIAGGTPAVPVNSTTPVNPAIFPMIGNGKFYDANSYTDRRKNDLPHWHQEGKLQFVTFRLNDSMPQITLSEMEYEKQCWIKQHPKPWTNSVSKEYFQRFTLFIDNWLDANYGSCVLSRPDISTIMEDTLTYFNHKKYILHDYVIMPNHVHVLLEVLSGSKLCDILHGWKSFSAKSINKLLCKTGTLWRRESYDRLIRNEVHYMNIKKYIQKNINQGGVRWMGK